MTLRELKQHIEQRLNRIVPSSEGAGMTRVIFEDVLHVDPIKLAISPDSNVTQETLNTVEKIVDRVEKGEPLQYIIGSTIFHGFRLKVTPDVLIPRPETSGLVDLVVDHLGRKADQHILDACTGSGAIAIALARELPFANICVVDISEGALSVARENVSLVLGKSASAVSLLQSDVLKDDLPGSEYDAIVSNPPYVANKEKAEMDRRVLDHEPSLALFVPDEDPLKFYNVLSKKAKTLLKKGGWLFFEINPNYSNEIEELLITQGFDKVELQRDYRGRIRYAIARND